MDSYPNQFIETRRGGKTTKIHAVVDGLSNPVYLQLLDSNTHDAAMAVEVLTYVDISYSKILADKAYETKEILDYLQTNDADYAILPESNTQIPGRYDWWLYQDRHLVKCFFFKLKNFRLVSTR